MLNVVSLKAQADDAVIRAEAAATSLRTAKQRLAVHAARMEQSRALARARAARDRQRAASAASRPA
jgi:hypothetical protein